MSTKTPEMLTREQIGQAIESLTMGDMAHALTDEERPQAQGFVALRRVLQRSGLANGSVEDPLDLIAFADVDWTSNKLLEVMGGTSPKSSSTPHSRPSATSGE